MQPRKQFTFYKSFLDAIETQPDEDQLSLYRAICRYAIYGEEPRFNGREAGVFLPIKPNLDAARKKARGGMKGKSRKTAGRCLQDKSKEIEYETEIEIETETETEAETEAENECITPAEEAEAEKKRRCVLDRYQTYCGNKLMPWDWMTENRRKGLDELFRRGYTLGDFEKVFQKAGASEFLGKPNKKGWKAGIDWLLQEKNFVRVMEGAFDDDPPEKSGGRCLDEDELAAIRAMMEEG